VKKSKGLFAVALLNVPNVFVMAYIIAASSSSNLIVLHIAAICLAAFAVGCCATAGFIFSSERE